MAIWGECLVLQVYKNVLREARKNFQELILYFCLNFLSYSVLSCIFLLSSVKECTLQQCQHVCLQFPYSSPSVDAVLNDRYHSLTTQLGTVSICTLVHFHKLLKLGIGCYCCLFKLSEGYL